MEGGRVLEREGLAEHSIRQACSVRVIEDKVIQGFPSCLVGYTGGVLMVKSSVSGVVVYMHIF